MEIESDDSAVFDRVMHENSGIGFMALSKMAAEQAMLDPRLTSLDKAVYASILVLLRTDTQTAWPSYELMARLTFSNEGSVRRALTRLRTFSFIVTKKMAPPGGGRALTHYAIGPCVNPRSMVGLLEKQIAGLNNRRLQFSDVVRNTFYSPTLAVTGINHSEIEAARRELDCHTLVAVNDPSLLQSGSTQLSDCNNPVALRNEPDCYNPVAHSPLTATNPSQSDPKIPLTATIQPPVSYIGKTSHKKKTSPLVTTVAKTTDLFSSEEQGPCPGVEIPSALVAAIDAGTAPTASRNFIDAVKSAQRRKVEAFKIEMACRKAVAAACKDAGEKEPPPSALLTRAVWYVERSDGETISVPLAQRSNGGPRARNMNRDFDVPSFDNLPSIHDGGWED